METSYFANIRNLDISKVISIALYGPKWITIRTYPYLYPKWYMIEDVKKDGDTDKYRERYYNEILNRLSAEKVYKDLKDCILLCWEKPGVFCHRRLVAEWIESKLGTVVPEI